MVLADLVPGVLLRLPRHGSSWNRDHPLLGFHSPSGSSSGCSLRAVPSACSFLVAARSLSWASVPYSDHQRKGSVLFWELHLPARFVFRVRALLTPSSPSRLPIISDGVAPGIPPSGSFSSQGSRPPFERLSPPGRCSRRWINASNPSHRTRLPSRFMTPREHAGKPSSGLCSPWESVPESHPVRVELGTLPSWFSSFLGFSLPEPGERPSPLIPLSRFDSKDCLAALCRVCVPAFLQVR